jgi:site-specific recombinase
MAAGLDPESRERLRLLLEEHDAVRRRVQMLSDVQTDLIRRSRRHLDILYNLVTNSMGVYEDPKLKRSSFRAAERGF